MVTVMVRVDVYAGGLGAKSLCLNSSVNEGSNYFGYPAAHNPEQLVL
jgi:hypothetical protein